MSDILIRYTDVNAALICYLNQFKVYVMTSCLLGAKGSSK